MEGNKEPNEHANEDPMSGEFWDFDEDDEELLAALDAEENSAVELLRDALSEQRGAEPPSAELRAAAGKLREGISGGGWPYEHVAQAAGWKTNNLPADDVELWLGATGSFVSPREDTGLGIEEEASIMAMQPADWLGAVIGLARKGVGAPSSPAALVSYINDCPEIEGEIDPEDEFVVQTSFELVLPAWEATGAIDDTRRLTALGRWGLPRALVWAWNGDF